MTITCHNCATRLQVDDAKAPAKPFTIRCPKCNSSVNSGVASPASERGALAIGTSPSTEHPRFEPAEAAPPFKVPDKAQEPAIPSSTEEVIRLLATLLQQGQHLNDGESGIDSVGGSRKVLVCASENHREAVAKLLAEDNYKVFVAQDTKQAVERMRANQLTVVLIDPEFDQEEQGAAFVTREVQVLRPAQRRQLFVVLLSPSLRTMDRHAAFLNNVNAIVNYKEIDRLSRILGQALREYNEIYRAFNGALGTPAL